jgi:hypothetical protein
MVYLTLREVMVSPHRAAEFEAFWAGGAAVLKSPQKGSGKRRSTIRWGIRPSTWH